MKEFARAPAQAAGGAKSRLLLVGANHRTAPTAVRERVALGASDSSLVATLREEIGPVVVLSTCNRTEIYCWIAGRPKRAAGTVARSLAAHAGIAAGALEPHLYMALGGEAARHVMRVAAGLDSLVLGEAEILGQVRAAWQQAQAAGHLGSGLDSLFRRAVTVARRIRAETGLSYHPSIAALAVQIADRELGGLAGRRVAVLGAGATGKSVTRELLGAGARVLLVNRSAARAAEVAATLRTRFASAAMDVAPLDQLAESLRDCDAVIAATASPEPVVGSATVAEAMAARAGRPLLLLDVAVPRDVDPAVRAVPGARLLDMDDLAALCPADVHQQRQVLAGAEAMAADEAAAWVAWCETLEAVPTIVALRRRAAAIREAELRRAARRLGSLSQEERDTIEALTEAIVNKLLHPATAALRRAGARRDTRRYSAAVAELFDLEAAAG